MSRPGGRAGQAGTRSTLRQLGVLLRCLDHGRVVYGLTESYGVRSVRPYSAPAVCRRNRRLSTGVGEQFLVADYPQRTPAGRHGGVVRAIGAKVDLRSGRPLQRVVE